MLRYMMVSTLTLSLVLAIGGFFGKPLSRKRVEPPFLWGQAGLDGLEGTSRRPAFDFPESAKGIRFPNPGGRYRGSSADYGAGDPLETFISELNNMVVIE